MEFLSFLPSSSFSSCHLNWFHSNYEEIKSSWDVQEAHGAFNKNIQRVWERESIINRKTARATGTVFLALRSYAPIYCVYQISCANIVYACLVHVWLYHRRSAARFFFPFLSAFSKHMHKNCKQWTALPNEHMWVFARSKENKTYFPENIFFSSWLYIIQWGKH